MAIYLKYDGIDGAVTTSGFEKWIELKSFQWGVARNIGTAARSAATREGSEPHFSEIVITKELDKASPKLLTESWAGPMNKTAKIKFTTTTANKVDVYLAYELTNVGISAYNMSSGGNEKPMESLSLNFTKISKTYTERDPGIGGSPDTVGYDMTQMKTT